MKVLVTGGCGFLGSHICTRALELGWEAVAFDNLTKFEYSRTTYDVEQVRRYNLHLFAQEGIKVIPEDVSCKEEIFRAIGNERPDFIAHCAAQPAMTIALDEPRLDLQTNVLGTFNVLHAAKWFNVPVANCSSIHVYGNEINRHLTERSTKLLHLQYDEIPETHPLLKGTLTPLHVSKRAGELYVESFAQSYDLPAVNFRLTGIYGPRQFGSEDHGWVANFAIKAITNQPIKVFGTDKQVRDILYVRDAAEAFFKWFENGCPKGTYNICSGDENSISIHDVLKFYEEYLECNIPTTLHPARQGDLWWFVGSYDKALQSFDWRPVTLPESGLVELLQWIIQEKHLFNKEPK